MPPRTRQGLRLWAGDPRTPTPFATQTYLPLPGEVWNSASRLFDELDAGLGDDVVILGDLGDQELLGLIER